MRRRVISSSASAGSYPEPTASECATTFRVTGVTSTNVSLAWDAGAAGTRVMIIASPSSSVINKTPVDFTSSYAANASYTAATDMNGVSSSTTTPRVVYDGAGTAMTVSGLSFNTLYYFRIFTYKANANNDYNTRNYNTANFLAVPARTNR